MGAATKAVCGEPARWAWRYLTPRSGRSVLTSKRVSVLGSSSVVVGGPPGLGRSSANGVAQAALGWRVNVLPVSLCASSGCVCRLPRVGRCWWR